ncbi:MAG TPA: protein-glutamate O-methyltransferase CheR [Acidobacteriaceae bacterium]|jgi:chemotaxis protein methyltransferase CheR|nr:protein-glutamate O-methyltransferase CheR [Acidobacteriaceae bacterium]
MSAQEEVLSSRDFARLRSFIYAEAGISLGAEKKTMLEARLKRRLRALELGSYRDYCEYLLGAEGQREEMVPFLDVVTTNKTDFFREAGHFTFLAERALPEMQGRIGGARAALVWSAGCSSGEEPYTLAMVLSGYGEAHPGFRFRILATDLSTQVLERARLGVYSAADVEPVPVALRRKYMLRSRERGSDRVRVAAELRRAVEFRRLNFMDAEYGLEEKADAIFCRNVIIYFDRPTQEKILGRLCRYLEPGGYLFVGHSETLHEMRLPLQPVGPALYRRTHGSG